MKLDLGSGFAPYCPDDPTWEHLDLNPNAPHVEYVCDAFGPLPFADGEVEELRAVDILEHGSYRDTKAILKEWARILKPGGTLFVQVPSAGTIMRWYAENDVRLTRWQHGAPCSPILGAMWRLLGGLNDGQFVEGDGDPHLNVHLSLFDEYWLRNSLERAGLALGSIVGGGKIIENDHPNLQATATRV